MDTRTGSATTVNKRILIITPFFSPNVGGAETYADGLCEYLTAHDCYVYVITYQPITTKAKGLPFELKKNLEIRRYPWIGFNLFHAFQKYPVLNFIYLTPCLFLHSFVFLLRKHKYIDAIDAQGLNAAFIARLLKAVFKKRAVMSTMALYNFKKGALFAEVSRRVLKGLDAVLAETKESGKELALIGVPDEKIKVFSHWVDQEIFKPRDKQAAKQRLGWAGKFVALFVGRAIPAKGAGTLLEVARTTDRNIHFAFISDAGPQIDILKEAASKSKNIIFVGGVNYKDLHLYYNAAEVFVIPSQYEEGAARVVLEAVSSGTPVVGSNRGALPSILDSSISVLVEPTKGRLKEAIESLYDHPDELRRLSENCRGYALREFSPRNAEVILNSY